MNLDQLITTRLRTEHEREAALHEPSGKLSASYLGKPLLEQVLKVIGVPPKPIDDYVLRLFARGKQVEDWALDVLGCVETQKPVEYRGCVGVIDGIGRKGGLVEVKSVKNSQLKWLKKDGAKLDHELQLTLYLLAEGKESGHLIYVSAEDFQTFSFVVHAETHRDMVESLISEVENQLKAGVLPSLAPRQSWHEKPTYTQYSNYPEWLALEPELMMEKLQRQFPSSYNTLRSYGERKKGASTDS